MWILLPFLSTHLLFPLKIMNWYLLPTGRARKNTHWGRQIHLPKPEENKQAEPKHRITSTIAPFLFSSYYADCFICLSLPSSMQLYRVLLSRHSFAGRKTHFPSGNIHLHNLEQFRSSFIFFGGSNHQEGTITGMMFWPTLELGESRV